MGGENFDVLLRSSALEPPGEGGGTQATVSLAGFPGKVGPSGTVGPPRSVTVKCGGLLTSYPGIPSFPGLPW